MNLWKLVIGGAAVLTLLAPAGQALGDTFWVYDGTTFAHVVWADGSTSEEGTGYSSVDDPPSISSSAVVSFADAHAQSVINGASSNIIAAGTSGLPPMPLTHSAEAAARANTTLNGLTPGNHVVSFDYVIGPASSEEWYLRMSAEVGFEYGLKKLTISKQGSGHYSSTVPIDTSAISFFAISDGFAAFNSANTNAEISNISVVPVPEPHTYWMFAAGLGVLAGLRKRANH